MADIHEEVSNGPDQTIDRSMVLRLGVVSCHHKPRTTHETQDTAAILSGHDIKWITPNHLKLSDHN
jgi:hypothetical protein